MAHWGYEHHGEIKTLQDAARADRLLWCFCTSCGRRTLTHPHSLASLAGGNFSLIELEPHLKCKTCKRVGLSVVIISPHLSRGQGR